MKDEDVFLEVRAVQQVPQVLENPGTCKIQHPTTASLQAITLANVQGTASSMQDWTETWDPRLLSKPHHQLKFIDDIYSFIVPHVLFLVDILIKAEVTSSICCDTWFCTHVQHLPIRGNMQDKVHQVGFLKASCTITWYNFKLGQGVTLDEAKLGWNAVVVHLQRIWQKTYIYIYIHIFKHNKVPIRPQIPTLTSTARQKTPWRTSAVHLTEFWPSRLLTSETSSAEAVWPLSQQLLKKDWCGAMSVM